MGLKAIGVKYFIPTHNPKEGFLASNGITVMADDYGSGVYLRVQERNLEPDDGESMTEFHLESEKQIDEFAAELKRILKGAQA